LEASEGDLLIDNKRIVDYNIKDLRAAITIIEQDPTLINASFR
jgi:ABC-type multidrug transport system fused ATPase/permease subunit